MRNKSSKDFVLKKCERKQSHCLVHRRESTGMTFSMTLGMLSRSPDLLQAIPKISQKLTANRSKKRPLQSLLSSAASTSSVIITIIIII